MNHHLNEALCQVSFKNSAVDECVCYQDETIFFYYINDRVFMVPDSEAIDKII